MTVKKNSGSTKPMVGGVTPRTDCKKGTKQSDVVVSCAEELLGACELMGFDSRGYTLSGTIKFHKRCVAAMGGDWMGFYKYKLAAFVAAGLDEEKLPAEPVELTRLHDNPGTLLGGKAGKWLELQKRKEGAFGGRWQQILSTFGTVKRAMPRPDAKIMDKSLTKAFAALTRDVSLIEETGDDWGAPTGRMVEDEGRAEDALWDQVEPLGASRDKHREVLRRVIDEVFGDSRFTTEDALESFFPSTNANILATRSKGGAVGHIMNSDLLDGIKAPGEELITVENVGSSWRSQRVEVRDGPLAERFQVLMERLVKGAMEEEKRVKLVALAEALKVRVISKGPVLTYTALKPLQKWLWKKLRGSKCGTFKLIGEEISSEYLQKQIGPLHQGEKYMSGDYKAATDNLGPWVSDFITKEIGKRIDDTRLRELFTQALTGHLIEDPDGGPPRRQTWGQLMGSVVSFPVLCIANAAICLASREVSMGRTSNLATAHIAVNGDDCVFRATEAGRTRWEQVASEHGMEPSVGKCFFSARFMNMNSAQFLVRAGRRPSEQLEDDASGGNDNAWHLEQVPAVNMGLLAGLGRSTGGKLEKVKVTDWGTLNSVGANARTLVQECAQEDRARVFKVYLNRNWDLLKTSSTIPWFLPEHLGGLGLPTFPDHHVIGEDGKKKTPWMPTDKDLRLAAVVYKAGKLPSKKPENIDWKVWDYAQERAGKLERSRAGLVQVGYEGLTVQFNRENAKTGLSELDVAGEEALMGKLCVEALFTTPFAKLFDDKHKNQNRVLRKVEREIARCMKLLGTVEPFSADALPRPVPKDSLGRIYRLSSVYHFRSARDLQENAGQEPTPGD